MNAGTNKSFPGTEQKCPGKLILLLLLITVTVVLCYIFPAISKVLQFDRQEIIANGEFWRLFTGHFTHWTWSHCFWDLLAFLLVFAVIIKEKKGRKAVYSLLFIAFFISSWLLLSNDGTNLYRGLSGLNTGLFCYASLMLMRKSQQLGHTRNFIFFLVFLVMLIAKSGYELSSGNMLIIRPTSFVPSTTAHLAGLVAGCLGFLLPYCAKLCFFSTAYIMEAIAKFFPVEMNFRNHL